MKKMTLTALALSCFVFSNAQITVRGIVSDQMDVLPEAHVYIKGGDKGTLTNINGTYELNAKKGDTIVVSYLGYEQQEIEVKEETFHETVLLGESLDEVLLTGNGLNRRRWSSYCCCFIGSEITTEYYSKDLTTTQLYPNPSPDGRFRLKFLEEYDQVDLVISNIMGQRVQSASITDLGREVPIDLSQFTSGIYLISIRADGKVLKTRKAIRK